MLSSASATRFDRPTTSGKTKPAFLACDTDEGEVELVAKFSQGCSTQSLAREAISALFAHDLGLRVPRPYIVKSSPEFLGGMANKEYAKFIGESDKYGFGSLKLGDGYRRWNLSESRLSESHSQIALEILAFDCWSANADRKAANHNMLSDGESIAIFDHEHSFMHHEQFGGFKEPWKLGALDNCLPPTGHVFFSQIRQPGNYDWNRISDALSQISNQRIDSYGSALPQSWVDGFSNLPLVIAFIKDLRDNVIEATEELKRSLK